MEYCYLIAIALIVLGFMLLWGLDIKLSFHIEINNTDRKDVVDETIDMDEDLSSNKASLNNSKSYQYNKWCDFANYRIWIF